MHQPTVHQLNEHFHRLKHTHLRTLFEDDKRFERYSIELEGLLFDYSKNLVDQAAFSTLIQLAQKAGLNKRIEAMFTGEKINNTEYRAVLHTALRSFSRESLMVDDVNIRPLVVDARNKMKKMVEAVHSGQWKGFSGQAITDVVNIGIGGSDLGPKMVNEALQPYHLGKVHVHFVSNVDGYALEKVLTGLNPETTLFIISSKSFTTQETMMNARSARGWLLGAMADEDDEQAVVASHFIAISSQPEKVKAFGIAEKNRFDMWDWVGGRYSLWSSIGLPIAFAIGMDHFLALLKGAESMDEHFRQSPLSENIPVIMALMSVWYSNFFHTQSQAVLSYDERLKYLPDYLQQADMESNGKSYNLAGQTVEYQTGVVLWGGVGTNGQHAFHQLLHQGKVMVPVDFIVAQHPQSSLTEHHNALVANCLAQAQAFYKGKTYEEALKELLSEGVNEDEAKFLAAHKVVSGNKPSNMFMFDRLSPYNLGRLIAAYEHKIFTQGVIWDINSFDQWGVELGKALGNPILKSIKQNQINDDYDCSTKGLLRNYLSKD